MAIALRTIILSVAILIPLFLLIRLIEYGFYIVIVRSWTEFTDEHSLKFQTDRFHILAVGSHKLIGEYQGRQIEIRQVQNYIVYDELPGTTSSLKIVSPMRFNARIRFSKRTWFNRRRKLKYSIGNRLFERRVIVESSPVDYARFILTDKKDQDLIQLIVAPQLRKEADLTITKAGNIKLLAKRVYTKRQLKERIDQVMRVLPLVEERTRAFHEKEDG